MYRYFSIPQYLGVATHIPHGDGNIYFHDSHLNTEWGCNSYPPRGRKRSVLQDGWDIFDVATHIPHGDGNSLTGPTVAAECGCNSYPPRGRKPDNSESICCHSSCCNSYPPWGRKQRILEVCAVLINSCNSYPLRGRKPACCWSSLCGTTLQLISHTGTDNKKSTL
mgnify:CR=1 FL=1